jgi:hypothetical protein
VVLAQRPQPGSYPGEHLLDVVVGHGVSLPMLQRTLSRSSGPAP